MRSKERRYFIFGQFVKLTSVEYQALKPLLVGHDLNSFLVSLAQRVRE